MSKSNFFKTLINFTKNLKTTGAVYKTNKKVERDLCSKIDESTKIVVEFGTGYGNVTLEILKKLPDDGKLYTFEVNEEFVETVKQNIQDPRLVVINDTAQNFDKYVKDKVDCFISTIPFTLIPKEICIEIIQKSYAALKADRYFCKAQYSKLHFKKFTAIFDYCSSSSVLDNIPPVYIYYCKKTKVPNQFKGQKKKRLFSGAKAF